MSTIGDLSINAKITISEETAQRCIQLLNIYLMDNPHASIEPYHSYDMDGKPFRGIAMFHNEPKKGDKE